MEENNYGNIAESIYYESWQLGVDKIHLLFNLTSQFLCRILHMKLFGRK